MNAHSMFKPLLPRYWPMRNRPDVHKACWIPNMKYLPSDYSWIIHENWKDFKNSVVRTFYSMCMIALEYNKLYILQRNNNGLWSNAIGISRNAIASLLTLNASLHLQFTDNAWRCKVQFINLLGFTLRHYSSDILHYKNEPICLIYICLLLNILSYSKL